MNPVYDRIKTVLSSDRSGDVAQREHTCLDVAEQLPYSLVNKRCWAMLRLDRLP